MVEEVDWEDKVGRIVEFEWVEEGSYERDGFKFFRTSAILKPIVIQGCELRFGKEKKV